MHYSILNANDGRLLCPWSVDRLVSEGDKSSLLLKVNCLDLEIWSLDLAGQARTFIDGSRNCGFDFFGVSSPGGMKVFLFTRENVDR